MTPAMKKIMTLSAVILFAMALPPPVSPQSPSAPGEITVREAIHIALKNNQDYRIALHKLEEAKEGVNNAWGQLWPVLESEASLARQGAENGMMSLSDGQNDIKIVQLRFGINPGIFYNSLQLSRKNYTVAREEVNRVKSEVTYNVIKSYFGVLLAGELIKMRKDSISLLRENLKDVESMYRTGSIPRFELLQAQVQLNSQEPLLLEAENNHRLALDQFNFHLGSDRVEYTIDSGILNAEKYRAPGPNRDETVKRFTMTAMKNRPEIIQIQTSREMAKHAENIQSSWYLWPTFSVGGYYGKSQFLGNPVTITIPGPMGPIQQEMSAISGTRDWQTTWQVRVAATYRWGSLVPVDSSRAMEREQRNKVKEAEESLTRLKRLISIAIRSDYSRWTTSYLTILSQQKNVKTAEEGLRIAKASYRAGVIKNSELLSAELALTSAKTGFINAVHGYYLSLAELQKEMGVDDEKTIFGEDRK